MITIKKYPNRRLYDTNRSQYINLEDIRDMVISHRDFTVVDSKSGTDITKTILLQIISEFETSSQQSLLTEQLLRQLIRFYGSDMQFFLRQYLELSLTHFMEQQDTVQGVVKDLLNATPLGLLNRLIDKGKNRSKGSSPASGENTKNDSPQN